MALLLVAVLRVVGFARHWSEAVTAKGAPRGSATRHFSQIDGASHVLPTPDGSAADDEYSPTTDAQRRGDWGRP